MKRPSADLLYEAACFLVPVGLFVVGVAPYWGQAPDLDAMINYREAVVLYDSGLRGLLQHRHGSVHPPLLMWLYGILFRVMGPSPFAASLLGLLLYSAIALAVYALFRHTFDRRRSLLASLFVLTSPLLVVCSFYPTSEALICLGWVVGLWAATTRRPWWLAGALAVLATTKSTGLVFAAALALVVLGPHVTGWRTGRRPGWRTLMPFGFFAVVYVTWKLYLAYIGGRDWNSDLLDGESGNNPLAVILRRLFTLKFLSPFFKQNLQNTLVVNFHWYFFAGLLVALALGVKRKSPAVRPVLPWLFGAAAYTVLVLSFPTWTIPRYALPVTLTIALCLPFLLRARKPLAFLVAGVALNLVGAHWSIDPVTRLFFGTYRELGQELYDLDFTWRGLDRVMINLQFPAMSKLRNAKIESALARKAEFWVGNCDQLRLGEKLWTISYKPLAFPQFPASPFVRCLDSRKPKPLDELKKLSGARLAVERRDESLARLTCPSCELLILP